MKMNEIGVDENKIEALVQLGLPRDAAVQSLKVPAPQLLSIYIDLPSIWLL